VSPTQTPDRRRAGRRAAAIGLVGLVGIGAVIAVPVLSGDQDADAGTQILDDATSSPSTSSPSTPPTSAPAPAPADAAYAAFTSASPEAQSYIVWHSMSQEERDLISFASLSDEQRNYLAFVSAPEADRAAFVAGLTPVPADEAPAQSRATVTATAEGSVWDSLAQCEAGGNWATNTGNGYSGGLQFAHSTWTGFGGREFAPAAWQASRDAQIVVAERVLASQGWGAWPACTRKLGLR
jgi:hypothetical protein